MRKPLSIILTLAMVVTMVFGSATSVFAAESTAATTMKIAGTDGTVTITTDKGKDIAAKVDTKLLNGYTIKTAAASYCFISLDDSKAIKLGQNTKVKVEKSGKKIELNVKNGEIYFDVDKKLSGNESMNIKTGNMTTGIRGTSGTLKTIKQGQNTIDLFQLFSGKTEMKANTQQGVQNIIERILGVLGIGSQTQTVTPVNGGNANAQPLESTMASAGQQIAITGADSAASTGPQNVPTFERQALAVSEFGTRSILESAAIKGGMSAGEALAAGTEQIVEQVGDLTQTLENAGVAQAAVDKIAEAAADPQTLDAQIAGAEQQAVQQTQQAEQTIEGAKEEAAKVEGTTTNTTENKVLENVEVKTDSGANASGLTLSDDGTSTAAPAGQTKPSSGSSSGGQQEEAWLTGYTGTYDCQSHAIATNLSARLADYDIWFFNDADRYNELVTLYSRVESVYAEVSESMAGVPAFGAYLRDYWSDDLDQFDSNLATLDSPVTVENVADSGVYYYFAIEKGDAAGSRYGDVRVLIGRAEISIKWYDRETNEEVAQNAVFPAGTEQIPVEPVIGVYRTPQDFVIFGADDDYRAADTISSGGVDVTFRPVVAGDAPQGRAGEYTVRLASYIQDDDGTNYTGRTQTDNYFLSGQNTQYTYSVAAPPVGSVVADQDFFSARNRATWGDYTTYDLAFIAESDGNESTYTKYARVNGPGTQSEVTEGHTVSEVLEALGSSSNTYNTILWDTGRTAQYLSPSVLSAAQAMAATASNRAIYISGAGIDCGFETSGTISMTSGGALLVVKIGDGAGLTASDEGTRFRVPNLNVGANTYVTNNGTVTLMNSITVTSGAEFINEGLVKFKDSGMSNAYLDGGGTFKNAAAGEIAAGLESPTVINGTGALINEGHMVIPCGLWITEGTTLLNRGKIDLSETHEDYLDIHGGTFTQEVPTGVNPDNVYVRDYLPSAFDSEGNYTGAGNGNYPTFSFRAAGVSGTINLNGGSVQKIITNNVPVNATADHLRLETIAKSIFGSNLTCETVNYTSQNGAGAVEAIKCTETGTNSSAGTINGSVVSGGSVAVTSDYFYVTSDAQSTPGAAVFNKISFPAPAGTYEVATNPTGLTIVSGAAANSWLAGYTGTYDTEKHLAISPTTAQNENYYIWLFGPNADEEFNTVKTSASALIGACTLAEPTDTLATELQGIREQLNGRIDNDDFGNLYEYSSQVASALDTLFAENVSDSGTWNYVAIPKTAQYDAYIGQFGVNITKAAIATKWYYEYEPDVEFTDGTTISISEVPDLHLGTPKIGIIVDGEFVEITQDYIIDEDSAQLSESRINISLGYPERDPYTEAGTYYATTSGITYTYNGNTVSGKKETANLYATDGALSISFVVVGTTDPTGTHINIVSGAAANSWLAGYTGAYDGTVHSPVSLSAVQQSDYWIWVFNDDDFDDNPNGVDYTPFLASMKAIFESGDFVATEESLAQVQSSIGGEQLPSVTSRALTYNDWHLISNRETLVQEIGVVDVLSSGDYNYFALPKHPTGSAFTGTFKVDITRAAVGVEWFVVHPDLPNALDPEWDVEENGIPASSRATQGAVYPYNNDVEVPVIPYLVAGPASSELYSMPNVGWLELNGEDFRGYELLTTNSAVSGAGTYSVTVTGIKCYDDQGNVIAEQMYVDNYYIDPATATYTYTLQPEGIDDFGAFMTSLDGKTGTELYGMFDVAYVARDNGSAYSDYTKYINGEAQETAATQAEMLGALASTTSYSSVYVDTGSRQQQIQGSENKLDIKTDGFNKVVIIDGGGFALAESGESTVSLRNVNSLEQDYDSEECKLYVKLMGTRNSAQLVTHNLEIEGNTQLVNQDSNITIVSGAAIKGSLYNEYVINIAEAATGSILIDGGGLYLKGTDAMIVDNRIATIAAIDGELTVTTVADMFQFDQSDLEQPAVLDISEGSADGGIRHAVVVEDSAEALVGDLEKACTAYLAVLFGEGKIAFSPNAGSVADSEYIFEDYFTQSNGEAGETIQFLECVYNYSTDGNITGSHYGSGGIIEPEEEDNLFFVSAGNLYVDGGTPSMICLSYPIH